MVVRCEFCDRQPVSPIILQVVHIQLQVLFIYGIHLFGLTIGLWMESSRQPRFDSQSCTETMPECRGKLRPSVQSYFSRQSMKSEDVLEEQVSQITGIDGSAVSRSCLDFASLARQAM